MSEAQYNPSEEETTQNIPQIEDFFQIEDFVGETCWRCSHLLSSLNSLLIAMDEDKNSAILPEDIVVEILLRLPVKPLFRFKCVSKRYKFIVSDSMLTQKYLQRAYSCPESWSSSGLLSSLLFPFTDLSPDQNIQDVTSIVIDSRDRRSVRLSSISIPNDDRSHTILGSSNGLILSLIHRYEFKIRFDLFVSNPLTKQCVQLPNGTTSTGFPSLEFGFATRREQVESSILFLTYKIVIFHTPVRRREYAMPITIEIFSSNTGSWETRKLRCPNLVLDHRVGFAYKGILHWLDSVKGNVITYDLFDNPDGFGCIELPGRNFWVSSLLYSGDHHETLRYCEVEKIPQSRGGNVDRSTVWRLVDPDKGEWCVEAEFVDSGWHTPFRTIMVAPNPTNRSLICVPYLREGRFSIIDSQTGKWRWVRVDLGTKHDQQCNRLPLRNPLIPLELCPWSCPFYAAR